MSRARKPQRKAPSLVCRGGAAIALILLGIPWPGDCIAQAPAAGSEAAAPSHAAVTNDDVIKMIKNGFDESTVLGVIGVNDTQFDVSPSALIGLKNAGVSEHVITAMLESARHGQAAASAATAAAADTPAPATERIEARPAAPSGYSMPGMTPQMAATLQSAMARAQGMGLNLAGTSPMSATSEAAGGNPANGPRVFMVANGVRTELASASAERALSQFKGGGSGSGASMLTSLAGTALHFAALGAGPAGMAAMSGFSMVSRFLPGMHASTPTMTYAWGLPGVHSERVLKDLPPSFEFSYNDIPGIDPDAYEPVLLKLVLTKDNYRLIGATRQKLGRGSAMAMGGGAVAGEWVAEDRLHAQVRKNGRGECLLEVKQALEAGEYGIALRPVKGYKARPSGFGNAEQLTPMVWDFSVGKAQ
jgi:hypothetical protein